MREPASAVLVDGRGCLTAAGLATIANSPPGSGPPELAAHVVACARCQGRLLARGTGPRGAPGAARPPSPWRTLLVAAALVLLVGVALAAALYLRHR